MREYPCHICTGPRKYVWRPCSVREYPCHIRTRPASTCDVLVIYRNVRVTSVIFCASTCDVLYCTVIPVYTSVLDPQVRVTSFIVQEYPCHIRTRPSSMCDVLVIEAYGNVRVTSVLDSQVRVTRVVHFNYLNTQCSQPTRCVDTMLSQTVVQYWSNIRSTSRVCL